MVLELPLVWEIFFFYHLSERLPVYYMSTKYLRKKSIYNFFTGYKIYFNILLQVV